MENEPYEDQPLINMLPTEILFIIFRLLDAKRLVICRMVCSYWKELIDYIIKDESTWKLFCAHDYSICNDDVLLQSPECESWYELYQSLSLWEKMKAANESIEEICHCTRVADELRDLVLLNDGLLAVHRRTRVTYYDLKTKAVTGRQEIEGDFNKFMEINNLAIVYVSHLHLYVLRWKNSIQPGSVYLDDTVDVQDVIHDVKHFIYKDDNIFFVTLYNQVFSCDIVHKKRPRFHGKLPEDDIITLSMCDGVLYILACEKTIYRFVDNKFVLSKKLDKNTNALNELWKHSFLETMDWKLYVMWMSEWDAQIEGPLKYIYQVRVHGNLFLVGTQLGVMNIYYKPFINGELNLYNSKPVKQYNFSELMSVLSIHPILNMAVVEIRHGHIILVVLCKKILLIRYTHDFGGSVCKAVVPYTERALTLN